MREDITTHNMRHESFRESTGFTTIPLGDAGTGTVERHPTQANMLVGTGTQFTVDFKSVYQLYKQNIWIYCATANEVFRVTGVLSDTQLVVEGDVTGVGVPQSFTYILADLIAYGVTPQSGAWTIEGKDIPSGESYYQEPLVYTPHHSPRFLDAVVVSGTLTISETR